MSTTANFNLPLLTATQAGKEITVNQALVLIDSALKAAGSGQTAATLTAAELSTVLMGPTQLASLIDTELAKLPVPLTAAQLATQLAALPAALTLAQLQTELAKLPTSSGGLTLAQLQAELANLPTSGGGGGITLAQLQGELNARPVPATVADVQAAVAAISVGGGTGGGISLAQLQAELAKLTPAAFASAFTKLGVVHNSEVKPAVVGAYPSVVYSAVSDRFYYLDYGRGLVEFDLNTQTHTQMPNPPLGQPGYATGTPTLAVLPSGKLLYAGAASGTSGASKTCYQFNPASGVKAWDNSLTYNSAVFQSFGAAFRTGSHVLVYGGTLAGGQLFNESASTWMVPDSYQLPTQYVVDGTTYAGYSAAKGCTLPSGAGLLLIPASNAASNAFTSLKITVDTTVENLGNTAATPTNTRFPSNSICLAVAGTSYGAVALVRDRTSLATKFWKFVEATGAWTAMKEGLGAVVAAGMACGPADQILVVTESGSNPGIYLLNAA